MEDAARSTGVASRSQAVVSFSRDAQLHRDLCRDRATVRAQRAYRHTAAQFDNPRFLDLDRHLGKFIVNALLATGSDYGYESPSRISHCSGSFRALRASGLGVHQGWACIRVGRASGLAAPRAAQFHAGGAVRDALMGAILKRGGYVFSN